MFSIKAVAPSISQAFTENVPSTHRKHQAELDAMDLDEDEFGGAGPSKRSIVSPGEIITSSKEYMRYEMPNDCSGLY